MSINFSYDPLDEGFLPSDLEEPSIQDFLSNEESRENSPAIPNLYNNYGKDSQNLQANMTLENTTAPESNARDEMLLKQEDRVNSSLNEFNHISPSDIKKEETDEDNLTPKIYENQTPKKPTTKKLTTKKRTRENKRKTYIRKSREENPNHKGIKELIIKVVFNDKVEEFHFKLGDKEGEMEKKNFEFKPTSRNDHFEFIMQGVNNKGQTFDIGKKVFPLTNVMFSEEYLVKIEVPETDDENKVAAYINAKITLFWNDINFEAQKKKQELKIKKLKLACKDAADYLKKMKEIYTGIKIKKQNHQE